jgi:hypothetical protein
MRLNRHFSKTYPRKGVDPPVAVHQADIGQQERIARQFKHPPGTKIRLAQPLNEALGLFPSNALCLLRILS